MEPYFTFHLFSIVIISHESRETIGHKADVFETAFLYTFSNSIARWLEGENT